MRNKWALFIGVVLVGGSIWYFFLKPHDYVVRFKTKALPGTVNQTLKAWNDRLDDAQFLEQNGLSDLKYRFAFNDSTFIYHWQVESLNDSVSRVKAYVTDTEHSLAVRWALPFSETDFEKRTKKTVEGFSKELKDHLDNFKVQVTGKDTIPAKYCMCVELKDTQRKKAGGMMEHYSLLSSVTAQNGMALDGRPLLEVEDWNMKNDSISYNFCFPVVESDSLPATLKEGIFYKRIDQKPAIRAVYNGNYITSDRAWYTLLDHAEKNNIAIDKKPLEVFYSNPNMGGNELEWETEVFLPIKN